MVPVVDAVMELVSDALAPFPPLPSEGTSIAADSALERGHRYQSCRRWPCPRPCPAKRCRRCCRLFPIRETLDKFAPPAPPVPPVPPMALACTITLPFN